MLEFHLGADFYRDTHGVLSMALRKYIERMIGSYEWKNRETKEKPISAIADDILNACDNYAKENEELETVRWKEYAEINERKMQNDKKAKLQSFSNILKYKSGHEVPNIFSMHWISLEALKLMQYFIFWKGDKIKNE